MHSLVQVMTSVRPSGRAVSSPVTGWNQPAATHDAASFIAGAANVGYTFNWFYLDAAHIAYAVSGRDPIRQANVDPTLPTWGTGTTEWQGFLPPAAHPHEIDPPQGWFTSWNNKPAPGFGAADDQYGYGPVFRSQSLDNAITRQLSLNGGRLTRAGLVAAMESAATVDLTGAAVLPELLATVNPASQPPAIRAMLTELGAWLADGAGRKKAAPGDAEYRHAGAVAAMDHLEPQLAQAAIRPLVLPVAEPAFARVCEPGQPHAEPVQHIHVVQLVAERTGFIAKDDSGDDCRRAMTQETPAQAIHCETGEGEGKQYGHVVGDERVV